MHFLTLGLFTQIKCLQGKLKEKLEIAIEENPLGTSDGDPSLLVVATEKLKSPQEFNHFIASSQNGLKNDLKYSSSSKVIKNPTDVLRPKHTQVGGQWIVVNGMAGIGKSKFCLKLRKQILDGETHSNRPIVPLPIEPRHTATLSRANCGKNALCTIVENATGWQCQGSPSPSIQFTRVCQYWEETRGRDVVFILDGIEKLKQEEDRESAEGDGGGSSQVIVRATELCKLLENLIRFLSMCTIVIATRPECTSVLLPLGEKMFRELQHKPDLSFVEVLGFTPDNIKTYINRRFNHLEVNQQQRQRKEMLFALLHQFPVLCWILRIPKELEEFCSLELPSCPESDVPAFKLTAVCQDYLQRHPDHDTRLRDFTEIQYATSGLEDQCALAFEQCFKHPLRENHLIELKGIGEKYFPAFFHHDVVFSTRVSEKPFLVYHFASDAVQEYLAAVHLTRKRKSATHQNWDLLSSDNPQMRNVLVFYNALLCEGGDIMSDLHQYLQSSTDATEKKCSASQRNFDPWDLAICLYESNYAELMKDFLKKQNEFTKVNPFPPIVSVPVHSQYDIEVLEFILKNMTTDGTAELAFKKVEIIAQANIHLTKALSEDDNLLRACESLEIVIDFTHPPQRQEKCE